MEKELGVFLKETTGAGKSIRVLASASYVQEDRYTCTVCSRTSDTYEDGYAFHCRDCSNVFATQVDDEYRCAECDSTRCTRIDGDNNTIEGKYCYLCDAGPITVEARWCCLHEVCVDTDNEAWQIGYDDEPDLVAHIADEHLRPNYWEDL